MYLTLYIHVTDHDTQQFALINPRARGMERSAWVVVYNPFEPPSGFGECTIIHHDDYRYIPELKQCPWHKTCCSLRTEKICIVDDGCAKSIEYYLVTDPEAYKHDIMVALPSIDNIPDGDTFNKLVDVGGRLFKIASRVWIVYKNVDCGNLVIGHDDWSMQECHLEELYRLGIPRDEIDPFGYTKRYRRFDFEEVFWDTIHEMEKIIEEWRALSKETGCEPCPIDVDLVKVTSGYGDLDGNSR